MAPTPGALSSSRASEDQERSWSEPGFEASGHGDVGCKRARRQETSRPVAGASFSCRFGGAPKSVKLECNSPRNT